MHIAWKLVAIAPRLGLRLQLHVAVSDWLSGSVGDLRQTALALQEPAGFGFPYGRTVSTSGFGWTFDQAFGLRGPASSAFDPEEYHRFSPRAGPASVSPMTWTARYVLGFAFGNSTGGTIVRAVPSIPRS